MKTYTKKQIREYIKNHDSKWWFYEVANGIILYYNTNVYNSFDESIYNVDYGVCCNFKQFRLWFREDLDEYFQHKGG